MLKYVSACEHGNWHLIIHPPGKPEEACRVFYRCRSWRHPGPCCRWKGAQDFVRVRDAIGKRDFWVYVVLTFSQNEWPEWKDQYKWAYFYWSIMRKRLTREYGKIDYIQTWERHKKGGIHVNLLLGNEDIWHECDRDADEWQEDVLIPMAVDVGFGRITFAQTLRTDSEEQMAGYLVKLARELVGAEVKSQIPFDAPKHFRRL